MPASVAAGVTGIAHLVGTKMQTNASGKATKLQTDAATEAARISALSVDKQLASQREEAAKLAYATEAAQKGNFGLSTAEMTNNYGQYITGLKNSYNQSGDTSFNNRASEISKGLTGVNMANTDAYNKRSSDLSTGHNAYAMYADRQRRLGALGQMLGQGPREITAYEDPAALREAQYFTPDPLQRTALELPPELEIPKYVEGNLPPKA